MAEACELAVNAIKLGGSAGERVHRVLHKSESPVGCLAWLGRRCYGLGIGARCRLGGEWAHRHRLGLVRNLTRLAMTARISCRGGFYLVRHAAHRFPPRSLGCRPPNFSLGD